ncbi:MAG: putative membrane protein [Oleiphilaceae bacterium]
MKLDFWLFLKGVLMGAADIVPGVSGGTIAFITGIYERLLLSLQSILPALIELIKDRKFSCFWKTINGSFLITLFSGILLSVIIFAKLIAYLLVTHPVPLWSFFFGLIVASVAIIGKQISEWNIRLFISVVAGVLIAYCLTQLSPASVEHSYLNAFLSGLVAICAMILPGISGSFILVMLGTYSFILGAIKDFDVLVLMIFTSGCLIGLLSIANVLVWAFSHFRNVTLALLTGFMIGALTKVWPWKEVLTYREDRHGRLLPLLEQNVLPDTYELLNGVPAQIEMALVCFVGAVFGVLFLESFAGRSKKPVSGEV